MKISREFHPYCTAFKDERVLVKSELLKSEKATNWEKQKIDASNMFNGIKNHEEFEQVVKKYNVFSMIFESLKNITEETLFPCKLFDGNEAWIGKDGVGNYRYFTGAPFYEAIGYTIFDLLLCFKEVKGKGYTQQLRFVRRELIDLLNVSFEDADWERKELMKYEENNRTLSLFKTQDFKKAYPKLFKKSKAYVDVLEKILYHGQQFIDLTRKDENDNSYFTMTASQSGVPYHRFYSAVKRFRELGLLFADERKVAVYGSNYMMITTCYSFPAYSKEFFYEVEEKL